MLSKTFGCTRMIYNHYLDKRIKLYEEEKITFGYTKCANDLTSLKKEKAFLKEVDSISLQQASRKSIFKNICRPLCHSEEQSDEESLHLCRFCDKVPSLTLRMTYCLFSFRES